LLRLLLLRNNLVLSKNLLEKEAPRLFDDDDDEIDDLIDSLK